MLNEQFNLSLHDFGTSSCNSFWELLTQTGFVSVTLVSEDLKQLKAHKVILSASSPVLRQILLQNPQQHPIIFLSSVSHMLDGHYKVAGNFCHLFIVTGKT